jgi:hypothetical protein
VVVVVVAHLLPPTLRYWCIILPWWVPSRRLYRLMPFWISHEVMAEAGNLIGDFFWTLEPAICLWAPKLLLRQRAPRRRRTTSTGS